MTATIRAFPHPLLIAPALLLAAASVSPAASVTAYGNVWRTAESAPPYEGPAEIRITREDARAESRRPKGGAPMPEIRIEVLDSSGRGVPGVEVRVGARIGKRRGDTVRKVGATDGRGTVLLSHDGTEHVSKLAIVFRSNGGAKTIGVNLYPEDKWEIGEAPYKTISDFEDAGSCRNLFELTHTASRMYTLTYHLPDSLLDCQDVEYGDEKKSKEFARVDEIGHRDVNRGDRNDFSREDEEKIGMEASAEFDKQFEHIRDPEIVDYVQEVMERVVAHSDAPGMPIHLRVVHTEDINAFVTAGGHVYVFTGLIRAAENESQLAGVLAHEVSHAIGRHVTEGATKQMRLQLPALLAGIAVGVATDADKQQQEDILQASLIGAGLLGMKYTRQSETEADLLGSQYLWNAGWDPEAIARFFGVMESKAGPSPPGWLSTHPTHEKRIENGVQWSRAFLPARERYLVDTRRFQLVRKRIEALPPPRKQPGPENTDIQGFVSQTPTFRRVAGGLAP